MATVFDMARLNASDYQFVHQASQGVLYDAVKPRCEALPGYG